MSREKQNIKSTDWLTAGYSEEEIAKMKAEAIKEAETELREKQIEEMARDIPSRIVAYNSDPKGQHLYIEQRMCVAEALYNAGYRKQKKGSWKVIKPTRENGKPSYICSVCGALYHEDVREWKGCPKCLSEMKGGAE